jgi:hypothetical protein
MFKKGSFEIGGTIYPVAIKVAKIQSICDRDCSEILWCFWAFVNEIRE